MDPACRPCPTEFEYNRPGLFHIGITTLDVDDTVKRVIDKGGKLVGEIFPVGQNPEGTTLMAAYVADPWGTVVELVSCSFESLLANQD